MVIGGSLFYSIHSFRFGRSRSLKFVKYEWFMSVTHWLIGGYSWLFVQILNIWGSARKCKIVYHYPRYITSCNVALELSVKSRYLNCASVCSITDYRVRCMDSYRVVNMAKLGHTGTLWRHQMTSLNLNTQNIFLWESTFCRKYLPWIEKCFHWLFCIIGEQSCHKSQTDQISLVYAKARKQWWRHKMTSSYGYSSKSLGKISFLQNLNL